MVIYHRSPLKVSFEIDGRHRFTFSYVNIDRHRSIRDRHHSLLRVEQPSTTPLYSPVILNSLNHLLRHYDILLKEAFLD